MSSLFIADVKISFQPCFGEVGLPMHSKPVLSKELPAEHVHTNEPWLFTQSPLMQGFDSHSFISTEQKNADFSLLRLLMSHTSL